MSYQGHIEDGLVVFDEPVSLPDGTEAIVEPIASGRGAAPASEDFWRERSIEELIVQQGVAPVRQLEEILGEGATLWDDDEQCDEFLRNVHDRRRDGISS
jgi:hypothetical protein